MRRHPARLATLVLIPGVVLGVAAPAMATEVRSSPTYSNDFDLGTAVYPKASYETPPIFVNGFGARFGWRFDFASLWNLWVQPEVGPHYNITHNKGRWT